MKKIITLGVFFLAVIFLSGCVNKQTKTSVTATLPDNNKIEALLAKCDEEQSQVNMPMIPSCYFTAFKNNGWLKKDVIKYLKSKKDTADIEEKIKNNDFWKSAWEESYK